MKRCALCLALFAVFAALPSHAATDRKETFGAVVGPSVLPEGGIAAYGSVGAPDLTVGYRQGFGGWELEARARLDYLQLSVAVEALAKFAIVQNRYWDLAPYLGVGLVGDTGSRYFDSANFAYFGVRPTLGMVSTAKLGDTVRGVADLRIPWDIAIGGGGQFRPTVGLGVELYLGQDVTGLVLGRLGVDDIKEPGGVPVVRLGWGVQLGLGFRLF